MIITTPHSGAIQTECARTETHSAHGCCLLYPVCECIDKMTCPGVKGYRSYHDTMTAIREMPIKDLVELLSKPRSP